MVDGKGLEEGSDITDDIEKQDVSLMPGYRLKRMLSSVIEARVFRP